MIKKAIEKLKTYEYKYLDLRILLFVGILCTIGVLTITSASDESYGQKQVIGIAISCVIMIALALIDYHFTLRFYWVMYFINLVLLLVVKFFGKTSLGAQRWIKIGGFQIQPSEFTKIFLILFFAKFIFKYKDRLNTLRFLAICAVLLAIPAVLILNQPDLSTTIVVILVFCAIMFLSGLNYKIIGGIVAVAIPLMVVLVYLIMQPNQKIIKPYQYNRLVGFYDEDNADAEEWRYQQKNSILAIGSGGLYGKGLNNNTITSVKNGNYLDEAHTDFIFTIVGEELGFVGTVSVVLLMLLTIIECFIIGSRAPDLAGQLVCYGLGSLLGIQSLINMGVVTMLLPNTGLTLPFVSSGVSSLLSLFSCLGIVLNISIQRNRNHYNEEDTLL